MAFGCNCFSERAIQRIYEAKVRPSQKPINVLTDCISKIEQVAKIKNPKERNLISSYMPGAFTIVLEKKEKVPPILTSGLDTIGIRIPDHKIALELLKNIESPLATTSVNISGDLPGTEISDFLEEFQDKVDIIIDGGPAPIGIASTIVQVDSDLKINVLRQGSIWMD